MACPSCAANPTSKNCPHLMFGVDGTYLTCTSGIYKFEPVDLEPLVEAAETDTELSLDIGTKSLIYRSERAITGNASADTISVSAFGNLMSLSDIGDVSSDAPVSNALLFYNQTENEWAPYTIPNGTIVTTIGLDVDGKPVKADPTDVGPTVVLPIGSIMIWPGVVATIPTGFVLADGAELNRAIYSDLFSLIGTTYGVGNGLTTFNIPNLAGNVPVGRVEDGGPFNALGQSGGERTHTLTTDEMPAHTHGILGVNGASMGNGSQYPGLSDNTNRNTATQSAGGNQAHNNLQPYITLLYIIRVV